MSWPSPQDYNEAIQLPNICFEDSALRCGQPEIDGLGLPRPISGAFASVYKLISPGRAWAVRCFLQSIGDQEARYKELSLLLGSGRIPHAVSFQYIPRGILVRNRIYPILKMEWINGQSLDQFVNQHFSNPQVMYQLADRFRTLWRQWQAYGIAHGDLQHGNIIVCPDDLKLVDYDGSYVPALKGFYSNELGHPNYQHPKRNSGHFGPYLDNFSAWVIYASLASLSVDPSLWQTLQGGDECLLFRHHDYMTPCDSLVFSVLEHHSSDYLQSISKVIRALLTLPPHTIPGLDDPVPTGENLPKVPPPSEVQAARERAVQHWNSNMYFTSTAVQSPPWPKRELYQEVVKQPSMCFRDKELRRAQYTYQFEHGRTNVVFHFRTTHKHIAVKCFAKDNPEREQRYAAVREALNGPAKPYLAADLEYIKDGIHVAGRWLPIVKMEWIQGVRLDEYLWGKAGARDRAAAETVLHRFRQMMQCLHASGIAHGDLSHQNLLITNSGIKLVDYDNMYTHSLSTLSSLEFGDPLFQHPGRTLNHFGSYLDNYAAWVIDNALTFLNNYADAFHWSWEEVVYKCRSDELMRAQQIKPPPTPGQDITHYWEIKPEIRRRAQLIHMLQQFPLEEIPFLVADFGTNALKREALLNEVNRMLQRYIVPL